MTIQSLIDNIIEKNAIGVQETFNSLLAERIATKLENKKRVVAQAMFTEGSGEDLDEAVNPKSREKSISEEDDPLENVKFHLNDADHERLIKYHTKQLKMVDHHEERAQHFEKLDKRGAPQFKYPIPLTHFENSLRHTVRAAKHTTAIKQLDVGEHKGMNEYHKQMFKYHNRNAMQHYDAADAKHSLKDDPEHKHDYHKNMKLAQYHSQQADQHRDALKHSDE
jgi:hypothetical protein